MAKREDCVVITGVGSVTAFGVGHEPLWEALETGAVHRTPLSRWGEPGAEGVVVGEWPRAALLGNRGLQYMRPGTHYLCGAAVLALKNAGYEGETPPPDELGIVVATNLAGMETMIEVDWTTLTEGPQYCSPMDTPNTLANAPASHLGIRMQARALNTTISSGQCSGLDAIGYALMALRQGRAKYILLGGVEELNRRVLHLYRKMGVLPRGLPHAGGRPFDPDSSGWLPGEGAAVLMLEFRSSAEARGVKPLAEVAGWHSTMTLPDDRAKVVDGLRRAIDGALKAAGTAPSGLEAVMAGASGLPGQDAVEAEALQAALVDADPGVPICSVKGTLGETYGAGGIFQAMAAVGTLTRGRVPATVGLGSESPQTTGLSGLSAESREIGVEAGAAALLTGLDLFGSASAVVLRAIQESD